MEAGVSVEEVLVDLPRFSAIDEMINIKLNDVSKITTSIERISGYLCALLPFLTKCSVQEDLLWFLSSKHQILDLTRNLQNIESMLAQVSLNKISLNTEATSVIDKCNTSLPPVKEYAAVLKKKLDFAMIYCEINEGIIHSLTQEIELCLQMCFKLSDLKFSSPGRTLPKFNLNQILTKMKISDSTTINYVSTKSIRLPTFNDVDESLYNEYLLLESKINPLKISLDIVPLKIEEFNHMCSGGQFPEFRLELVSNYEKLLRRWDYLQLELKKLKHESLDSKWNEIFKYLIKQIIDKCQDIIDSKQINSEIASTYRLCSNTITIISQSIKEEIIYDQEVISLYNRNLLPKWHEANDIMGQLNPSHNVQLSPTPPVIPSGLRSFNTKKNFETFDSIFSAGNNGFGIDLGVNIETSNQNYSIKKLDRIRDYFELSSPPPISANSKDLLLSLQKLDEPLDPNQEDEDDVDTLVGKTPSLTIKEKILKSFDLDILFEKLLTRKTRSKLPIISAKYVERGLPIIKKKFTLDLFAPTKLPGISPDHPVFHSPERLGSGPTYITIRSGTGSPRRRELVTKESSAKLNNFKIPNLLYDDISISFNSTSPERPSSLMGSRFDTAHLIQSYRNSKPNWR